MNILSIYICIYCICIHGKNIYIYIYIYMLYMYIGIVWLRASIWSHVYIHVCTYTYIYIYIGKWKAVAETTKQLICGWHQGTRNRWSHPRTSSGSLLLPISTDSSCKVSRVNCRVCFLALRCVTSWNWSLMKYLWDVCQHLLKKTCLCVVAG